MIFFQPWNYHSCVKTARIGKNNFFLHSISLC
jgi:hypothetical protein